MGTSRQDLVPDALGQEDEAGLRLQGVCGYHVCGGGEAVRQGGGGRGEEGVDGGWGLWFLRLGFHLAMVSFTCGDEVVALSFTRSIGSLCPYKRCYFIVSNETFRIRKSNYILNDPSTAPYSRCQRPLTHT